MAFSINRRTALVTAVAAALPIPRVRAADDGLPGWKPMGVSEAESRTLAAACERILPPTSTPGAAAFGVPQFVDRAVASWCSAEEARAFRAGLAQLEAAARSTFGVSFAAATAAQQDALLTAAQAEAEQALARGESHYFVLLRDLATVGYFQSEPGCTQVLRYDPVPGEYRGCVPLEEIGGAWAL